MFGVGAFSTCTRFEEQAQSESEPSGSSDEEEPANNVAEAEVGSPQPHTPDAGRTRTSGALNRKAFRLVGVRRAEEEEDEAAGCGV